VDVVGRTKTSPAAVLVLALAGCAPPRPGAPLKTSQGLNCGAPFADAVKQITSTPGVVEIGLREDPSRVFW
jgi:hypothetical protein